MSKYKINSDYKAPTDEQINKTKNFSSVLNEAQGVHQPWYVLKNIYRKPKLLRTIILIMIIFLALYFTWDRTHIDKQHEETVKEMVSPQSVDKDSP